GQALQEEVLVLNLHGRADVDLHGQHPFELAALLVEVDHLHGLVAVDPVLMVVAADQHAVLVPLVRLELLERQLADDPGLARAVNDDLLAGVGQDAAAALLVEHAVVVGAVGHHVALVAGDDPLPQVGALGTAVVDAAVAAGADLHLHAQLEVLRLAAAPDEEAVVLEGAVRGAGQAAVLDPPVPGAALPAGEVAAVEDRLEALGRLRRRRPGHEARPNNTAWRRGADA